MAKQLLESFRKREDVTPILMALLYLDVDDKDHAFEWFEKGIGQHSMFIDELKVEPM
jgi:hypothetical protein